jgi:hypothetical protein
VYSNFSLPLDLVVFNRFSKEEFILNITHENVTQSESDTDAERGMNHERLETLEQTLFTIGSLFFSFSSIGKERWNDAIVLFFSLHNRLQVLLPATGRSIYFIWYCAIICFLYESSWVTSVWQYALNNIPITTCQCWRKDLYWKFLFSDSLSFSSLNVWVNRVSIISNKRW